MNHLTTIIKIFLNLPFLPPSIFKYSSNFRVLQQCQKNVLTRLRYISYWDNGLPKGLLFPSYYKNIPNKREIVHELRVIHLKITLPQVYQHSHISLSELSLVYLEKLVKYDMQFVLKMCISSIGMHTLPNCHHHLLTTD